MSWPDVPDIPDRGDGARLSGFCPGPPGDGVIDSLDMLCHVLSGVDPAHVMIVQVSWLNPSTCQWTTARGRGNSSTALPASTIALEGWPDPEWTGEMLAPPASGCWPMQVIVQIPHDTIHRHSDEILCGVEGRDWTDVDADGDPDTCPNGIFDGTTPISILSADTDPGLPPTGELATSARSIARSVLATDLGLAFLGDRFPLSPGDAVMVELRPGHRPTLWLPPGR